MKFAFPESLRLPPEFEGQNPKNPDFAQRQAQLQARLISREFP